MSWFRVDDGFHSHRKTRDASLEAIGLWTMCGSWSAANLEDGFIPDKHVRFFAGNRYRKITDELARRGMLDPTTKHGEPGWLLHDYLDWNPSRETVLADRDATAERVRKWREKRRADRANGVTDHERNGVTNGVSNSAPTRPVPYPPNPPQAGGCGKHPARAKPGCANCRPTPTPPPLHVVQAEHDRLSSGESS